MNLLVVLFPFFIFSQDQLEVILDKGYDLYLKDKFEKAIETFNLALTLAPDNPETYLLRGLSHHGAGEVMKSIEDMQKAIDLDPNYIDAYREIGYIYLVGQAPREALEAFDKAIALDPSVAELYVNRGTAKCMLDDANGAKEDWKKAKELGVAYSAYMKCD